MNTEFILEIPDEKKIHLLKITQCKSKKELTRLYKYRYSIYHKYGLIDEDSNNSDCDHYDEHCIQIIATFDDSIIGCLRVVWGNVLPTIDYHFDLKTSSILKNIPREKIFQVGRIISTPKIISNLVSSHFILLIMFQYVVQLTKSYGLDFVVGSMKERVVNKLDRIKFPIQLFPDFTLVYKPKKHEDKLYKFYDELKTGKVYPVFVTRKDAEIFFSNAHFTDRTIKPKL